MKALQFVRNHPIVLGSVLAGLFACWVAFEDTGAPQNFTPLPTGLPQQSSVSGPRVLPEDPTGTSRSRDPFRPGVVTAELITRLHPGMTRVDVEELIGLPPAGLVQPVSSADGKLTYRASYLANLDSLRESQPQNPGNPVPRSIIAIEFDASRPGHPLVKIHIPDPMS